MSSAYVCAACRKSLSKRAGLYHPWQCVSRPTSTLASPRVARHDKWAPGLWPGYTDSSHANLKLYSTSNSDPIRSAEDDFLHRMFHGRKVDHSLYSSAKWHNGAHSAASLRSKRAVPCEKRLCRSQHSGRTGLPGTDLDTAALISKRPYGTPMLNEANAPSDSPAAKPIPHRPSGWKTSAAKEFQPSPRRSPPNNLPRSNVSLASQFKTSHNNNRSEDSSLSTADLFQSRVGRAIEKQDVSQIEGLWAEAQQLMDGTNTPKKIIDLRPDLLALFLWGFMSVRRPNRAVDVWNKIMESSIKPTAGMWDTMLNGFGAVRNSKGVEEIWNMMVNSGFKPDKRLFVTRIRALAACELWHLSMKAFEEMMTSWLQAVKRDNTKKRQPDLASIGDFEQVPKPSVEALNGLVPALVRSRKQEQLMQVLSWAKTLGIPMDAYTFNPIIRMALKDGNADLASKLLGKMQDLGIQRDIATYTMILQALFQRDRAASGEGGAPTRDPSRPGSSMQDKLEDAMRVLEEVARSGLVANAYTYSTLISGLLYDDAGGSGLEAAHAVREDMERRNIPLSSQIYTSFVTAHFAREGGPDLDGVVRLWERARQDRSAVLDGIFFDRLVEGFAKCGEIGRMKAALAQAGKGGKVPGWTALTEAIVALSKAEDWIAAREVVEAVRVEEQALDRVRKGKGKKWFWDNARALGLGDEGESQDEPRAQTAEYRPVDVEREGRLE